MKKVFIILIFLSTLLMGNNDISIKKQCEYILYGNGENQEKIDFFMNGIIEGTLFTLDNDNRTVLANLKFDKLKITACKESFLNNSSATPFTAKFLSGLAVTVDKRYYKYRKVK